MTKNYRTFNEIDPTLFRNLIRGSEREESAAVSTASGIMNPPRATSRFTGREEPIRTRIGSLTSGEGDQARIDELDQYFEKSATAMRNSAEDPEALANAVVPEESDQEADLSDWESMPPPPDSQTEQALGEPDPVNVEQSTQGAGIEMVPADGEPVEDSDTVSSGADVDASIAYPSNIDNTISFAQRVYPDDPRRAAALAATIRVEGMNRPVEDLTYRYGAISQGDLYNENVPGIRAIRRDVMLRELGQPVMKDEDGNILYRTVSQSQTNMRAQEALKEAGLYDMAIDGQFGTGSQAALRQFQEQNNLEPTGILDSQTMEALGIDNIARDHEGNLVERREPLDEGLKQVLIDDEETQNKLFDIWYMDYYRAPQHRLGNPTDGQAHRYIGRGPIQITGREAYERLGNAMGVDLVENPELLEDPEIALRAVEAFIEMKDFGEGDDPRAWMLSINPGMSQAKLNDRMRVYNETLDRLNNASQTQVTESLVPRPRPNR